MPRLPDLEFVRFTGQNSGDPVLDLGPEELREAVNVEFHRSSLGRKRKGSSQVTLSGISPTNGYSAIATREANNDPKNMELFLIFDESSPVAVHRLSGGSWASVTIDDAPVSPTADGYRMRTAQAGGKLYLGYRGTGTPNRLYCYDPDDDKIRRVGLATPAAPTVADTGSGSYAATERWYKVSYTVKSGTDILRRSELSDAVSFTPSGSGTDARVTKPATISEGETHWELWASFESEDGPFRLVAETVVGTTTYDDNSTSYAGVFSPSIGTNLPPPACPYLLSANDRLLMAGSFSTITTAGDSWKPSDKTVWFTPRNPTNGIGDDERVPNISGEVENRLVFPEPITALVGPLDGDVYVFSYRQCWRLVQTGNSKAPYIIRHFANVGCTNSKAWDLGTDEAGAQAIYFMSSNGPARISQAGLLDLSDDLRDIWDENFAPATTTAAAVVRYYPLKHQVYWWYSTGVNSLISKLAVFEIERGRQAESLRVRGGWTEYVTSGTTARVVMGEDAVLYPDTIDITNSHGPLKLYVVGKSAGQVPVWKLDDGTTDYNYSAPGTVDIQAYVTTRAVNPAGFGQTVQSSEDPYLFAEAASAVTITLTAIRDFGAEETTATADLTAVGSETDVRVKLEGLSLADAEVVQFKLGDVALTSDTWELHRLVVPLSWNGRDGTDA